MILTLFTKSIIQHNFYIDIRIEIGKEDINIFISAPHWNTVLYYKVMFLIVLAEKSHHLYEIKNSF